MSPKTPNLTDAERMHMKAEEILKQKQLEKIVIEPDIKRLTHELQVHQIELEMQNEELRLANETAEIALKKYTMLYDFAPMGYFTLDNDGSILDLNFTGAEILGDKRFSLVSSNFKLFVHEASQAVFTAFLDKVFSSNAKEACEIILGYDKTILCSVFIEGIVTGDDQNCLLSVVDISKFKK